MLQAMDVIMGRVEALTEPLRSAEDCDCVRGEGVGKDNVDKLKEIVRTGAYRRNEQLAQDAHHQAIKLVRPWLPVLAHEHNCVRPIVVEHPGLAMAAVHVSVSLQGMRGLESSGHEGEHALGTLTAS